MQMVLGVGSAVFGVLAIVRPSLLEANSDSGYFARMYAARSIPLGVAVAWCGLRGEVNRPLLAVSAAAQVLDAAVGVAGRQPGQVVGAGLAATAHLLLVRREPRG